MQYVGQTGRSLKTWFREHFPKMKKSKKKLTRFFIAISKNIGHSPSKIIFQPVEKIIYDPNSSSRLKNIKRHETELRWITFFQSPFPLGLNDNTYHEGNVSKMPDFDGVFFLFRNVKNIKVDLMPNVKMATLCAKFVLKTHKYFSKGSFYSFK